MPLIVTSVPAGPESTEMLVIVAEETMVKLTPLLVPSAVVTVTFPVVAPLGTGTVMLVADQLVGVPVVPLNETVLLP